MHQIVRRKVYGLLPGDTVIGTVVYCGPFSPVLRGLVCSVGRVLTFQEPIRTTTPVDQGVCSSCGRSRFQVEIQDLGQGAKHTEIVCANTMLEIKRETHGSEEEKEGRW